MSITSSGALIAKTGISPGNYPYWASQADCDAWFQAKVKHTFEKYSIGRVDSQSKHGYNVGCMHLDMPYDATTECDYIMVESSNYPRKIYGQVVEREYVNELSTRIYFVVDYVASYFDTITLGKCLVQRTHVTDDWTGGENSFTASKYLLAEPVPVEIRHRPDLLNEETFQFLNDEMQLPVSIYNLITTVGVDGDISQPKINYQCGGAIVGFLSVSEKENLESILGQYVTYANQLINMGNSLLNYVSSIYVCPVICSLEDPLPIIQDDEADFKSIVDMSKVNIKHAKTLDYFRLRINANSGSATISFAEYGQTFSYSTIKTGSPQGNYSIAFKDSSGDYNGIVLSSFMWPSVGISATVHGQQSNLDAKTSSILDELKTSINNFNNRTF